MIVFLREKIYFGGTNHIIMKKILLLLLICCAHLCIGQSNYFTTKETTQFKDTKKGSVLLDVHQMENGENIVVRSIKKNYVVSSFTESYDLKSNVDVEREKNEGYIGSINANGLVRFFTVNRQKKMKVVYCYTFDPATEQVSKKALFEVANEEKPIMSFLRRRVHLSCMFMTLI